MITGVPWRDWLLTLAVLVIGFGATAGAAVGFDQSMERDRGRRFDAAAERARGAVEERLQLHTDNLAHLRNWILVNPDATREEFHRFTALGFDESLYLGVQALSFVPRVDRDDLARFEASVQAETAANREYPPFVVHPASAEAESYPVTYVEPLAGNEAVFGFDLGSDPPRRRAIEAARDRGDAVGTGPVRLVQETGDQTGFVLFSPMYDTGDVPATAPARRRHFVGVVNVVFRVGDMFAGVLGPNSEADAEMYDLGPTVDPPAARYEASTRLFDTNPDIAVASTGEVRGLHRDLDLNIGERRWRMVLTPASGFASGSGILPLVVVILGSLVSVLLAGVMHFTTQARGRAERRAREMTADLRVAEERSRSILLGAPDAMLVVDGGGEISSVNHATEALFGYSAEELEGKPIEMLLPADLGETHRAHRSGYLKAPRRREMGADLELLGRRRDGANFPLEVSLSPLVGPAGTIEVIAAVRDVSERRAGQAALQDAYDHEREAAEQLREADELKTTFLNTISHELRTPLTAITGFTDLLLTTSLPPEQRDDYLRRVQRNAQSLGVMIAEVLTFSRLESQDVLLNPLRLELASEASLIIDQLSPVLESHVIVIDAPEPVFAHIDREALARILTNLLTNAARYSPSGTTVTVSVVRNEDRALVSVTDEGPGIPATDQVRVFDRFFRGATALASRVPGTGIGLAVVSELAQRSGGSVQVGSADGGGARFEVELPGSAPE